MLRNERYQKYKAIIFDLDGTLIDSLQDLTDACNEMLVHYDLPPKTYEEGKGLIGRGLRNLCKRALPKEMRTDEIIDEAHALMQAAYEKRYTAKTLPYDGIREMLTYLKDVKIPFALNTNKPDQAAKIIIGALFDCSDFVDIIGQSDDWPRKPDPMMALKLAERMGAEPSECIYCGDSLVDYETGQNAGMQSLLCTWGFTKPEILYECENAICLDDSRELLPFLQKHTVMSE